MRRVSRVRLARGFRIGLGEAIFLVPGLALFGAFVVWPSGHAFYYAFTNWNGFTPSATWVGLRNFRAIFASSASWSPVATTLKYTVGTGILLNVLGLGLALALNGTGRLLSLLRSLFLIPLTLSLVATSYVWNFIFSPDQGTLNRLLRMLHLGSLQRPWLGDPHTALWSIVATAVWQGTALFMLIYLAGLQGVPSDLHEAASLDGAGPVRRFWHITVPMLVPAFLICIPFSLIGGLKVFDVVQVMTGGGPGGATETLATAVVKQTFTYQNAGYATALGVVLFAMTLIAAVGSILLIRRFEVRH